ncbi:methyl-accepting chemotaxis protein [Haloferax namakaokahaiae]|uniref:Methyl-accepting chemotaxis protein n=1 Tax=Haloferax namakaokahaiae TaxID=1748331 RepID=A0ABD5ZE23_9EURY
MSSPEHHSGVVHPTFYDPPEEADEVERLRDERDFWKHLFEDLVESFPEPVLTIDDAGRIVHWNEKHEDIAGIQPEEAIGRLASDVIGTKDVEETLAEEIVRTGKTIREDTIRHSRQDSGSEWSIRAAGQPLRAPDGTVVGAFEYVSRVTDLVNQRRQVERAQEQITTEIESSVSSLLESSTHVAEGSQFINETTTQQVSQLSEVREEMTNLSATIEEVASSADEIRQKSNRMERLATESREDVAETFDQMRDVSDSGEALDENVDALRSQFADVEEVTEVIDDIAKKINLLALNANIEAARSGEAGSGFAVVANEIKQLAEQTGEEVQAIEQVVDDMATVTEATADGVETTTDHIEDAIERLRVVDENQETILSAAADSAMGVEQVAEATDAQASSATEVSSMVDSAVDELAEVADEISELAEMNEAQAEEVRTVQRRVRAVEAELDVESS